MKKVLITGGAGFIGYHLADLLIRSNYHVDLLDNFSRGVNDSAMKSLLENRNVNFFDINLLDKEELKNLNKDYSLIFHFAAIIGVKHVLKSPYDVLANNFKLLDNILNFAKNQKKLEKFIFASTSEVYSGTLKFFGIEFPTTEKTPLTISALDEPRTTYMLSKIYGEALCLSSGLPSVIIRPHNFYGPRMGLSHVIPELMKKSIETNEQEIDVFSTNHSRSFCFIEDAVKMIKVLAESSKAVGEAYNIGNENEEIKMGDLAQKIIALTEKKLKINPKPSTPGSPERRCPGMTKFNEISDFQPQYNLEQGLKKTYEWYSSKIFSKIEKSAI